MNHRTKTVTILALLFLSVTAVAVFGDPSAPRTLTPGLRSTFNASNWAEQTHEASAGNITALVMYALAQTRAWQGYYGNITATITLDDALNNTFYNWSSTEPRGQVYATLNNAVVWDEVKCFNFSNDSAAYWDTIETFYNIEVDDVDGVNETYTATNHPSFVIGSHTVSGCPTTYIFSSDTVQTTDWANVLLYDPNDATDGWVYATIIENDTVPVAENDNDPLCYHGGECDFQILVNEDGHGTDIATTTYYFWVELL